MWYYVIAGVAGIVALGATAFAWAACTLSGDEDDRRGYPRG
jgi:hypothetical protein